MEKLNILDKLKYLKDVLNLWECRELSLVGRILIFKSLALSKLLYASTMKCLPKQILDQLNTLRKSFTWSNRKPKIKHSTLNANYSEGGYKDIDIKSRISALKITWVTRLLDTNFHPWKIIPNMLFSNIGGLEIMFYSDLKLSNYCASQLKSYPNFFRIWFSYGQM